MINSRRILGLAALLSVLTGCSGNELGGLGNVLGGVLGTPGGGAGQQGQLLVEVQGVNAQQRSIDIRTEEGQTGTVMYDQNTVVIYQQQQYPPTALERGDIAMMELQQVDQNRLYTPRIEVQQSVQDRTGQSSSGQLLRLYGQVGTIDHQRGFFDLQTQQGTYTVFVPANAGPANTQYFHRLNSGQNITVEGTLTGSNRLDLERFI